MGIVAFLALMVIQTWRWYEEIRIISIIWTWVPTGDLSGLLFYWTLLWTGPVWWFFIVPPALIRIFYANYIIRYSEGTTTSKGLVGFGILFDLLPIVFMLPFRSYTAVLIPIPVALIIALVVKSRIKPLRKPSDEPRTYGFSR